MVSPRPGFDERIVEIQYGLEKWNRRHFSDIIKGDIFRLYEKDEEYVGKFLALSDPYVNERGIWEIESKYV
jgi:hypothetical protein